MKEKLVLNFNIFCIETESFGRFFRRHPDRSSELSGRVHAVPAAGRLRISHPLPLHPGRGNKGVRGKDHIKNMLIGTMQPNWCRIVPPPHSSRRFVTQRQSIIRLTWRRRSAICRLFLWFWILDADPKIPQTTKTTVKNYKKIRLHSETEFLVSEQYSRYRISLFSIFL